MVTASNGRPASAFLTVPCVGIYALKLAGALGPAVVWLEARASAHLRYGPQILLLAVMVLRRGVLHQDVLVEFGAVAAVVGGIGHVLNPRTPAPITKTYISFSLLNTAPKSPGRPR